MSRQNFGSGSSDRSLRSLINLQANASSARTLNLMRVWRRYGEHPEFLAKPFFKSPVLNRSIIVKHRLRLDELDLLQTSKASATKVILPIDMTDLKAGARTFFVGQTGYIDFMQELSPTPGTLDAHDSELMRLIEELPSLDPFLLRERLKKSGYNPARCYFDLSEGDTRSMFAFVRGELGPLINMSFGDVDARADSKTGKLASKMLGDAGDAELEPLRLGLGMSKADFGEGLFCWKGFIYYKWTLTDLLPQVRPITDEIQTVRFSGPAADEERAYLAEVRGRLARAIAQTCATVRDTLKIYDDAYAELTRDGQPQGFRDFLMQAPRLFHDLGERLGSVHHILSFWRYRFPASVRSKIGATELCDLFADFEASLTFDPRDDGDDEIAAA